MQKFEASVFGEPIANRSVQAVLYHFLVTP